MDAIDAMTRARGRALDDIALWSVLLKEPLDEACAGERDKIRAAGDFLDPIIERIAVPRRIADGVRRIAAMLPRLSTGRVGRFGRTELMGPALDVLEAELLASGRATDVIVKLRSQEVAANGQRPARARSSSPAPRRGSEHVRPRQT